jgi:hypothetical protein
VFGERPEFVSQPDPLHPHNPRLLDTML